MLVQTLSMLILITLSLQATPANPNDRQEAYETAEAYEVYSAILPSGGPWRIANAKRLVIRRETASYTMCLRPEKQDEQIIGPAITDYVKQNQKTWLLQPDFRLERPYEIITSDELRSIFEGGIEGWEKFYEKYPESGGYILLSAVGFNADKTIAVVYMRHSCGGLCGEGQFYVLNKQDGKWMHLSWKGGRCSWAS
jgi:hypothetical protein